MVQSADEMQFMGLANTPAELDSLLSLVGTRFIMQFANANNFIEVAYPGVLIGDTTAPSVRLVNISTTSSSGVNITWTTDQFTTSNFEYGTQPEIYSDSVLDEL